MDFARLSLFLILFTIVFAGCQKATPDTNNSMAENFLSNLSYGSDAKQRMDVFLPANRNSDSTKSIILIHGGAWIEGDKSDFYGLMDALKSTLPGWGIFNVNYRLADTISGTNIFPAQENDIKKALEFIYTKQAEFGVSQKYVLLGASAGAHLAQLQAYKYQTPIKAKALVSLFGPCNMEDMYNQPASILIPTNFIETLLGGIPASVPDNYIQSSPIHYIDAESPPTISFHGGLDFLVKPAQQDSLHARLDAYQVMNQKHFYPMEGHGWTGNKLLQTLSSIQAFLYSQVQ